LDANNHFWFSLDAWAKDHPRIHGNEPQWREHEAEDDGEPFNDKMRRFTNTPAG